MSAFWTVLIIRYQVFTFKMNDKGEAIYKETEILTDFSINLLYLVRMIKYTLEDISPV